jgi:hypothetical protein
MHAEAEKMRQPTLEKVRQCLAREGIRLTDPIQKSACPDSMVEPPESEVSPFPTEKVE